MPGAPVEARPRVIRVVLPKEFSLIGFGKELHERLCRAIALRRPAAGLVRHTDRGSQYCSLDDQAELRRHGVLISMSGKGNCFDNAMVETFFKTLESELVWRTVFQGRAGATTAIGRSSTVSTIPSGAIRR